MIKCVCNKCGKEERLKGEDDRLGEGNCLCEKCWKEFSKEENKLREKYKLIKSTIL